MSWYTEDKKMREDLIGKAVAMCKSHGYELDEEDQKMLKRMKFAELLPFVSKLLTRLGERQHEVVLEGLEKANEAFEKWLALPEPPIDDDLIPMPRSRYIPSYLKHGLANTKLYAVWIAMQQRCYNPSNHKYKDYGGRGIRVCQGYHDFKTFYADMAPKPSPDLTIDRKNNDGHYSCGKCDECIQNGWVMNIRWATHKEQQNNKRPRRRKIIKRRPLIMP